MYTIRVQAQFNAAHNLRGYQGKCERLHGHNWKVEVVVESRQLNNLGMVYDFQELKKKLAHVLATLDHSYLNRLAYFKRNNPTSEKIAEFIYAKLKRLVQEKKLTLKCVSVWESDTQQASFSAEDYA